MAAKPELTIKDETMIKTALDAYIAACHRSINLAKQDAIRIAYHSLKKEAEAVREKF